MIATLPFRPRSHRRVATSGPSGHPASIVQRARARMAAGLPSATTHIDRFVVLRQLGRGGMGTVYAAYDDDLDREVAVKVVRDDLATKDGLSPRAEREALALEILSHPNVITAYGSGLSDHGPFLVMELVRGRSVAQWFCTQPHWQEVLDVFLQIGRGLCAVHRAGLVHRDLKPSNLMLGDDGVAKILDFGLVRRSGEPVTDVSASRSDSTLTSSLTVPGTVMGTPVYMSPEQLQGLATDFRSDQFSFCVVLYEGLYGRRPHPESSIQQRLESILVRDVHPVPADTQVPTWVHDALMRGLAPDPAARWPSMEALLEVLSRQPTMRHRWWRPRWWPWTRGSAAAGPSDAWRHDAR